MRALCQAWASDLPLFGLVSVFVPSPLCSSFYSSLLSSIPFAFIKYNPLMLHNVGLAVNPSSFRGIFPSPIALDLAA